MAHFVEWPGKDGRKYTFETLNFGIEWKPLSGVYIVSVGTLITGWTALYVGEAESFYDRINAGFQNHDGLKCAARHGATHIGVLAVGDKATRLAIETELRHVLNPSCNRQPVPPNALSLFDIGRTIK